MTFILLIVVLCQTMQCCDDTQRIVLPCPNRYVAQSHYFYVALNYSCGVLLNCSCSGVPNYLNTVVLVFM